MIVWTPPPTFDGYKLTRKIGQGGMGQVFLATDTLLDRLVAVKFISAADASQEVRRRFFVEARAIARLQHPNVVAIHRVGEVDGKPYLVSEFVRGEALDCMELPVPWTRALSIGIGVARGLAAAHRRGVVHRDVKPGNILLTDDGEPKLLDFGIAKLLDPGQPVRDPECPAGGSELAEVPRSSRSITIPGAAMGTPLYMAPEVWLGEDATFRSDVYSLGALLYKLCTGEPPHDAPSMTALFAAVVRHDARPLLEAAPGVDPHFAAVVDRCLSREPSLRFESANEVRAALSQLTPEAEAVATPTGNPYRGLHAFEAEHSALFFGRDGEIRAILERLRAEPCIAVAGDSGAGKSSICRAGVLPKLPSWLGGVRTFTVVTLVPGEHPIAALAAALAPHLGSSEADLERRAMEEPMSVTRELRGALGRDRGLVMFVDQLEELVTHSEPREAAAAAELLGWIASPSASVRMLTTVRGDFLGRLAALPRLGDAVTSALYVLRPLTAERLRDAIVKPAQALGVSFESDALVDALVGSTAHAEGGLPLLQFALAELWDARDLDRNMIPASALDAMGGVAGALGRHADNVLAGMSPPAGRVAKRLLLRLVTAAGTRARRTVEELVGGDAHARAALEALVRGRLVVARQSTDGGGYEIAHEALLHGWSTLAGWLSGSDSKAARRRLSDAVLEWLRLGRAREALWSARQMAELAAVDPDELTPDERSFIAASRRERRRVRAVQSVAMLAVPLALSVGYGSVALKTQRELAHRIDEHLGRAGAALLQARAARAEAASLRGRALESFDALDRVQGEEVWARALAVVATLDTTYGLASQEIETALMLDPKRSDLRARFADLLQERALSAEEQRNAVQKDELLRRLAVYDDTGERTRRLQMPASLTIKTRPAAATVRLLRYGPGAPSRARDLGVTPLDTTPLEPGSYLLILEAQGRTSVRCPLSLSRGEQQDLSIDLPRAAEVPAGFVYIPPGRFLFGSGVDDSLRRTFFNAAPLHEVRTGAYLVAQHETTFADWFEYLRALPPHQRPARYPQIVNGGFKGALVFRERPGGNFELAFQPAERRYTAVSGEPVTYPARDRRASQDWRSFPVFGINVADAEAYLAWLDASGRVKGARLCSEHEWERAARGSDERPYPHGARLLPDDANHDETYGKAPLGMGPDEVGAHPASRSPFGLDDMAGNVWEWTTSSMARGEYAARGGGYYFDATSSRSDNRQVSEPSLRDQSVGMRVCADAAALVTAR